MLRRPACSRLLPALLAAAALLRCAGPPDPEAEAAPDPEAAQRALDAYLEQVRDFDVDDTLEAYALGARAEGLTPELMRRLESPLPPEDRDASEARYHLIRLGCIWIRESRLDPASAGSLHDELDAARWALRPGTRDRRAADFELESCQPALPGPPDEPAADDPA